MKTRATKLALGAVMTAFTALACAAESATPLPAQWFFQRPSIAAATFSPDGRYLAVRKLSSHGRYMLTVVDIAAKTARVIVNHQNADVSMAAWSGTQRLTYTLSKIDFDGKPGEPGVYAIDRDGSNRLALTTVIEPSRSFAGNISGQERGREQSVMGFPPAGEELIVVVQYEDGKGGEVQSWNTRTGKRSRLGAPEDTFEWLLDQDGKTQIAVANSAGVHTVYRNQQGPGWKKLVSFDTASAAAISPALYVNGELYVHARNGGDTAAVYRYDLEKNALAAEPMINAPGYDMDGSFVVDCNTMLGYRFTTDAPVTVWFDKNMQALQQEIDKQLPATYNKLGRGARSETPFVLVSSWSDLERVTYRLYDTQTKAFTSLEDAEAPSYQGQMSGTSLYRFKARDGLDIPAYLTLPRGKPATALPAVVLVGDRPWNRSAEWGWTGEVQFLASRGYAVLQPQARGMRGFGMRHQSAGYQQWGLAMQDDLADAVKWAVKEGYVDPARVCIAGTGYGGYAAMMGLIKDPDVYRCGINWSGITDLTVMFNTSRNIDTGTDIDDARRRFVRWIGDPERDAERFRLTSPLHNASRITQPVLLAYGTTDVAVPYAEGRKLYEAISAGNRQAEWLSYTHTTSDWKTQANRIDLWRNIDAFLQRHIGKK